MKLVRELCEAVAPTPAPILTCMFTRKKPPLSNVGGNYSYLGRPGSNSTIASGKPETNGLTGAREWTWI